MKFRDDLLNALALGSILMTLLLGCFIYGSFGMLYESSLAAVLTRFTCVGIGLIGHISAIYYKIRNEHQRERELKQLEAESKLKRETFYFDLRIGLLDVRSILRSQAIELQYPSNNKDLVKTSQEEIDKALKLIDDVYEATSVKEVHS